MQTLDRPQEPKHSYAAEEPHLIKDLALGVELPDHREGEAIHPRVQAAQRGDGGGMTRQGNEMAAVRRWFSSLDH